MLESLMGKVMAGLLSVSALMFSSYTGNNPVFKPLHCRAGQNYLYVTATLSNAFDNDFADVFKCGKPITLIYKIDIRHNNSPAFSKNYRYTVTFDPMNATWMLTNSENNQRDLFSSYSKLLESISELFCVIPRDRTSRTVEIRAEAWLLPIELTEPDRTVDLMVLWKMKRPKTRTNFNLPPAS